MFLCSAEPSILPSLNALTCWNGELPHGVLGLSPVTLRQELCRCQGWAGSSLPRWHRLCWWHCQLWQGGSISGACRLAQETCGILRLTWVRSLPQRVSCVFSLLIRQGLPGLKTWFKKLPLFQKSPSWSNLNVFPLK